MNIPSQPVVIKHNKGIATGVNRQIIATAIIDAFCKLDPRTLIKSPVMFTVEIVAALTTVLLVRDIMTGGGNLGFTIQIVCWLWFTVVFANFAEAVAEGRGKAQAEALKRTRTTAKAKKLRQANSHAFDQVSALILKVGDLVLVE